MKTKSAKSRRPKFDPQKLLAKYPEWKASLRKASPKLRAGAKMMVNTRTYTTFPIFTIEIWHQKTRRYLPLRLPDGTWSWEKASDRNAMLSLLQSEMAA